jgi:hypothetical protein
MFLDPLKRFSASSFKVGLAAAVVAIPFSWAAASLVAESGPVVSLFGKSYIFAWSLFKLFELLVFFLGYAGSESVNKRAKARHTAGIASESPHTASTSSSSEASEA